MKRIILTLILLSLAFAAGAQISYKWTPVPIDSTFDNTKDFKATEIIAKYSDLITPMQEILCYSPREYEKARPESELSNFAADAIKTIAEQYSGEKMDLAMTNFGGIRTSLPKGAIRVYDVYSVFPFNNTVVIVEISGKNLMKLLGRVSTGWIEALSNVEILVDGTEIKKFDIAGEPVNEDKIYKLATINFLLDGGDGNSIRNFAEKITDSGIFIRDGIVDLLREMGKANKTLDLQKDGRVKFINQPERPKR